MDGIPTGWRDRPLRAARRWVAHARHEGTHLHALLPDRGAGLCVAAGGPSVMIVLDGSRGEGGGQILRTALSLSLLTGKPFQIAKIRANRAKPGLRPQHLAAVEAAALLGSAEVSGAAVGSCELTFRPGAVEPRDLSFAIGTAGSSALVLHTLALPIAMAADRPVRLAIEGGTFNTQAPSYPFLEACWRRHMASLGLPIALAMPAAGYYPRGGGRIEAWIEPARSRPLQKIERGPLIRIHGVAGTTNLHHHDIANRMRTRAIGLLADRGLDADIGLADWPGEGAGAAISLTAEHEGGTFATFVGLGERGKPAEKVAEEAVAELLAYEDAPGALDPHSADQILLPLAMAEGRSEFTTTAITEHLRTNAQTIRTFLDREILIEETGDGPGRVIVAAEGRSR